MHKRVLLISENYPPITGGSGRWFFEIYSRLGCERLAVLSTNEVDDGPPHQARPQLEEHRMQWGFSDWSLLNPKSLIRYAYLLREAIRIAREIKAEDVHCGRNLPEGFIGRLVSMILRIPLVCFCHGEELNTARSSRQLYAMTKWMFAGCSRVIANSQNTARLLRSDSGLDDGRLQLLYPGVESARFAPAQDRAAASAALGWTGRTVLLTVGRLQIRKGHDHVIKALSEIKKHVPDVLFAIVGRGQEEERLKALVTEYAVSDAVEFRGEIEDSELLKCYQACDLFVLANREVNGDFEGFGMVLIEAQASGRPVLGGNSGGAPETMEVGVTGELTDADNVVGLGQTIIQMLSNRARLDEMGRRGVERVRTQFDWDALASRAKQVLLDLR